MKMKNGFTMIELIFVIVILGILAGIGLPRLLVSRDDATLTRIRADIASIRGGISNAYNGNLMLGNPSYPSTLDSGGKLFGAILSTGVTSGREGWSGGNPSYILKAIGKQTTFTYDSGNGTFTCPDTNELCKELQ